jgi:hypothetical protein
MTSPPVDRVVDDDDTKPDGPAGPLTQMTRVLAVRGDVDGLTADALRGTVRPLLTTGHRLVLELPWAVVAGDTVRRLLRAVGADRTFPAVESLAEALCAAHVVDGGPRRVMPVVAESKVRC